MFPSLILGMDSYRCHRHWCIQVVRFLQFPMERPHAIWRQLSAVFRVDTRVQPPWMRRQICGEHSLNLQWSCGSVGTDHPIRNLGGLRLRPMQSSDPGGDPPSGARTARLEGTQARCPVTTERKPGFVIGPTVQQPVCTHRSDSKGPSYPRPPSSGSAFRLGRRLRI
jgi:hypothetical protein